MKSMYRVVARITQSRQHTETHWTHLVRYIGDDLEAAAAAYHESRLEDCDRGYGNQCRETYIEIASVIPDIAAMDWRRTETLTERN